MGASQVTAGGVVVKVLADNQDLEKGLRASAQKLAGWAAAARATVGAGLATTGSVVTAGLAGAAVAGTAVVNTVGKAGRAIKTAFGGADVATMTNALQRLTPVSTRVWDVTQSGIGRGTRLLAAMREGLAAAGVAAMPLLAAFDGIARRGAGIVTAAKWKSLFKGDFASAGMFSQLQKPAREAWLQDRWRQGGATGILGASVKRLFNPAELFEGMARFSINPLKTTGAALKTFQNIGFGGIGGRLNIATKSLAGAGISGAAGLVGRLGMASGSAAKSIASMATSAVKGAAGVVGLSRSTDQAEKSVSRLLPKLSSMGAGLRSLAIRGGVVGAGILGTLTAAAGIKGGIGDLFSANGFAKHAAEMGDSADKHKTTVGVYSNYHAAAQIAGVSLDDALSDPKKMAKVEAQRGRAASLGGFVTASQLALAREANSATAEMGIAFRAVGTAIGSAVLPQIIDGVRWTTTFASAVANFIQENPALIQQLFSIGKGFAIGAAAAAAIATAIGFVMSPIGGATIAIGALTAAFPTLWAMAAPYLGNITAGLTDLKTGFDYVFGGILDALAAGNLGLAAEVALAGLGVAWETGIAWVDQKWREWSETIANVFDDGLTAARIKLDEWFPGFETAFSESMAFLEDAWTVTVNSFLGIWDTIQSALTKSILYLSSLFSDAFDLKGAMAEVDQEFERKAAARGRGQEELLAKRDQERQQRAQRLATEGTAAVLNDELKQRKAARAAQADPQVSQRLKDAQARLEAARQQAKAAKEEKEQRRAAQVEEGSLTAKSGAKEAETKGAAANDIRTREGLQDVLIAYRGQGGASLNTLASQGTEQIKTIKEGNTIHEKNRVLLDVIAQKKGDDKPIG